MKKFTRNKFAVLSFLVAVLMAFGLLSSISYAKGNVKSKNAKVVKYNPVTISNFDSMGNVRKVTFTAAPKRAITLNQATTEILLALGLEKSMVGTCYKDDVIMPSLQKAYNKVPVLSDKYPSKEIVLAQKPDFLFGWKSAFFSKNLGETYNWDKKGIKTYISKMTVSQDKKIEYVYEDILNIGKIFGVETKAKALVKSMKIKVNTVQDKVKHVEKPVKVAIIDDISDNKLDAWGGNCLEDEMVMLAGGINVLADVENTWGMSTEVLIDKNPDVIVINDWNGSKAGVPENKIKMLKSNPALAGVNAIKNNRFVVIPLTEVYGGSIRTADGVVRLAKGFYPEIFK